jgi:hypothetical protein
MGYVICMCIYLYAQFEVLQTTRCLSGLYMPLVTSNVVASQPANRWQSSQSLSPVAYPRTARFTHRHRHPKLQLLPASE